MTMFKLAKAVLSRMDPETAHNFALKFLKWSGTFKAPKLHWSMSQPVKVMGITFPNPVGLAAGLDKDGEYIDCLGDLGFGFVEVGAVTPRPQSGNPRPRIFRIPEAGALINRMGFNNKGVANLRRNIIDHKRTIIGVNIGRNADTNPRLSIDDYKFCMSRIYTLCSYIVINISSPNTVGLRNLEHPDFLEDFISGLWAHRLELRYITRTKKPLVVKLSPDLSKDHLRRIADILVWYGIDGIIATNSTLSREGVEDHPHSSQAGGLSGGPLKSRSLRTVRILSEHLKGKIPIIGVGGIRTAKDALEMMEAGAKLIQVLTGFVEHGPTLIHEIIRILYKDRVAPQL